MRKQGWLWAGVLIFSTGIWAQSGPDRVCEVNVTTPKDAKLFEAARKKHNEFHKAEKDKTAIEVWSIMTGPDSGKYMTASCGMTWKEMDGQDAFDQRDAADREKTMAPAVAKNEMSYFVFRPELSSGGVPDGQPAKMMTVVHYFVKPGGIEQFNESLKRLKAGIAQSKWPGKTMRVYSLVSGGEGPHYVVVTDRNGYAEMQGPDQSLTEALKQVYGNDDKTIQNLREAVDHTMSEMMAYRADLSYPGVR